MTQPRHDAPGLPPALSLRHLSKRFGGEHALDDVSLDLLPGEVLGLLGQNGSGKSTLIKVLAGFHAPEPGAELEIYGQAVKLPVPPGTTEREGLAFVHQHLGLVPSLTVLENLRMNTIATHARWWVNWREESRRARDSFERFGLAIDPEARIADLAQVDRALVAIVRAFEAVQSPGRAHAGILVLDEPTPFLPTAGVEQLFSLIRAVVRDGASVIFVSHDVDEVKQITDRATVLRDGRLAGTLVTADATHDDFIELIVGRRIELFHAQPHDLSTAPIAATVRDASGGALSGVSLDIRHGEIVGFAGLIGSGFDDLPYLLYGAQTATSGTLLLPGKGERLLREMSPNAAIADGITLLPSDRLGAAGVGGLSVADNVSLPVLHLFRAMLLDWGRIFDRAAALGAGYEVRPNQPSMRLASLSGGNQQKVLLAKWMQTQPRLLMLDEPTQGVDVGARQHLFAALAEASERGVAVVIASTDYEQLAQICDRVLIFARGAVVAELTGGAISKARIAELCLRGAGSKDVSSTERFRHDMTQPRSTPTRRFSWVRLLEAYALLAALILLGGVFGIIRPEAFLSWNNISTMLGSQAVLVVLTMSLIIPLTAGDFDLSVASMLTLSAMILAVLNAQMGVSLYVAMGVALAVGAVTGVINAWFILYFRIPSLIVTLGTGTFINGIVLWMSGSMTISGLDDALTDWVVVRRIFGIPLAFYYAVALVAAIWYFFDYTMPGRRLLFVGRGREVARLSGIRVSRVRLLCLVASGVLSAAAGIMYAGTIGAADPLSGLTFLLPGFAAAFLGATSISPGRFNAWGSLVAVYFLVIGITGLTILGIQTFVQNLFYGGGLVLAVALSQLVRRREEQEFT